MLTDKAKSLLATSPAPPLHPGPQEWRHEHATQTLTLELENIQMLFLKSRTRQRGLEAAQQVS